MIGPCNGHSVVSFPAAPSTSQEVRLVTLEGPGPVQSACAKSHMTSGRVHVLFIEFPTAHAQSSYKI